MKRVRSVVSLCLIIAMSLTVFQGTVSQAAKLKKESAYDGGKTSGKCGENAEFALENGVLTISGNGCCGSGYDSWDKSEVTKIAVKDGITGIDSSAFADCSNLSEVEFAGSV